MSFMIEPPSPSPPIAISQTMVTTRGDRQRDLQPGHDLRQRRRQRDLP